jgi:hypothetical protein
MPSGQAACRRRRHTFFQKEMPSGQAACRRGAILSFKKKVCKEICAANLDATDCFFASLVFHKMNSLPLFLFLLRKNIAGSSDSIL